MNKSSKCKLTAIAVLIFIVTVSCFGMSVSAENGLVTFSSGKGDVYWPYFDAWMATGSEPSDRTFPSFAVRFKAGSSFVGGMMALYVEGNSTQINVRLHQWNTDYATSVNAAPKATASFQPVSGEAGNIRIDAGYTFPSAQPAGEYVAVFEVNNPEGAVIQLKSNNLSNHVDCYVAGNLVDVDFFGGIMFENVGAGGFKPLVNERITFSSEIIDIHSNDYLFWEYFNSKNEKHSFDDFAVRFKAESSFTGGMLGFYVEDTVTLKASLYKWNKDYETSTSGAAQTSVTFDVSSGSEQSKRLESSYSFSSAQPAGEYIIVFEVVSPEWDKANLMQLKTKDETAYVECFMAGTEVLVDFYGGILFEKYDDGGFEIVEKIVQRVPFYDTAAESIPLQIASSYAIQFSTGMPFDKISIKCPSWSDNVGSLRWSLYAWQGSYLASIKGEVLATVDFVDFYDSHDLYFTFENDITAGEYLLLIENITETDNAVGIYGVAGTSEYAHLYKDGKMNTEASAAINIGIVGTETDYYGTLSAADTASGKNPDSGDVGQQVITYVMILIAITGICAIGRRKITE